MNDSREPVPDERHADPAGASARESVCELMASVGAVVWESGLEGLDLSFVAAGIEWLVGASPSDWRDGERRLQRVHVDDRERVLAHWRRQRREAASGSIEYRVPRADGRAVRVREHALLLRSPDGRPCGFRGVLADMTARHGAAAPDGEPALLDAVAAWVAVLEADGRIVSLNRAGEAGLGRPEHDVAGKDFAEVFALAARRAATQSALAAAASGRPQPPLELAWFPAEGGERTMAWTFVPCWGGGDRPVIVATGVDSSERRRAPHVPSVAGEPPHPDLRLEPFARSVGGLAHDYNNALTALLGFSELLATPPLDETTARIVTDIRESAGRIAGITTRLRALVAGAVDSEGHVAPPGRPPGRRGRTLLLAEDEPIVRRIMVQTLQRDGWSVLDAASGAEALRRAREAASPPDLLVTDIVMPGMDGRELAERVRRDHPGLPVLFVTGFSNEADPSRLPPGPSALLLKPFLPEDLASRARQLAEAPAR